MTKKIGIGLFLLVFASCKFSNTLESDKKLSTKIETAFVAKDKKVDFSQFDGFNWNQLLILGPYSAVGHIEKILKLDLSNIKENGIEYSDAFNLLIFIENGKSIKISEVSRSIEDFTAIGILIDKNEAIFQKTANGKITLVK